jgi:MerR family transcriptional regulator, light-induced transcriptional regulator
MNTSNVGTLIDLQKNEIAELIVAEQWRRNPAFTDRYGPAGKAKCIQDVGYNLSYLSESIAADSEPLFLTYIQWVKSLFEGLKIPTIELSESLSITAEILKSNVPGENGLIAAKFIDAGIKALTEAPAVPPSFFLDENPLSDFARKYLSNLRNEERSVASEMILDAVKCGTSVKDIYLGVFEPSQREIGRLWQTSQMTVAEEHYCTAATQLIMSQLYPNIFSSKKNGRRMVAVCTGNELHEIGLHMVADIFEMEGWDTYYLGANTPTSILCQTIEKRDPDILAISGTMTFHVKIIDELIDAVKTALPGLRTKILVGGYPFNIEPELWSRVGADGSARNAVQAVAAANQLIGSEV